MSATIITALISAAVMALSGALAYRAQNRGVSVSHEGVVMESYDELVAHLRADLLSTRAEMAANREAWRIEMEAMRKELAQAMGREARCEARIHDLSAEVATLTEMVRTFTDPGSPD